MIDSVAEVTAVALTLSEASVMQLPSPHLTLTLILTFN